MKYRQQKLYRQIQKIVTAPGSNIEISHYIGGGKVYAYHRNYRIGVISMRKLAKEIN